MKSVAINEKVYHIWGEGPFTLEAYPTPEGYAYIVDKNGVNTVSNPGMDHYRHILPKAEAEQILSLLNPKEPEQNVTEEKALPQNTTDHS